MTTERKSIAFLGPFGSFSSVCYLSLKRNHFPAGGRECENFSHIVEQLTESSVGYALLPLENSSGGNVNEVAELIWNLPDDIKVQLEYVLPVNHNLLVPDPTTTIDDIQYVCAHPQTFEQCRKFFQQYPHFQKIERPSNSEALEYAKSQNNEAYAAIGPGIITRNSSDIPEFKHGYHLRGAIQDYDNNCTRFWLLGRDKIDLTNTNTRQTLCSFAFRTQQDQPGSLLKVLQPIQEANVNMSRIVSIPTKHNLCEYVFFVDCNGDNIDNLDWTRIKSHCSEFKFLGQYPVLPANDPRFI